MHPVLNGTKVSYDRISDEFPLTANIRDLFSKSSELDFIIVSQYAEGVANGAKSVRIFEPRNMEKSLKLQKIKVYDYVSYTKVDKRVIIDVPLRRS